MHNKYDLVIVGAGAAGLIAAGRAAELGSKVLLIEKNKQVGVKILITGKGRCNITNAEDNLKQLVDFYGKKGKFLYSAFKNLSNFDVIDFFENLRLQTKVERGKRVFPLSDNAKDVVTALKRHIDHPNVEIRLTTSVKNIIANDNSIEKLILTNGEEVFAKNFLITTGGKSYPQTGSTGDAYDWFRNIKHKVIKPHPALTPIVVHENIVTELAGLSLKNVEITLWDPKKVISFFGEALFTHNGLSGPITLNLSNLVNLSKEQYLTIDFKPALDSKKLDTRIIKDFDEQRAKQFKNSLNQLLPSKLIPIFIKLSEIPEDKKVSEISKKERKRLLNLFKEFKLTVKGLVGYEKAIVTAGGVDIKEIKPKTMQSKKYDNLYVAGELLDIDGPTGGYNLQVAWSTGYLAAESVAYSLKENK